MCWLSLQCKAFSTDCSSFWGLFSRLGVTHVAQPCPLYLWGYCEASVEESPSCVDGARGLESLLFSVTYEAFVFLFCQTCLSNLGLSIKIFLYSFPKLFYVWGNSSIHTEVVSRDTNLIYKDSKDAKWFLWVCIGIILLEWFGGGL